MSSDDLMAILRYLHIAQCLISLPERRGGELDYNVEFVGNDKSFNCCVC